MLILWISGIICFVAQGVFNNLEISGFLAFSLNWLTIILFLQIFSKASGTKLPIEKYHKFLGLGLVLSIILFLAKRPFEIASLPFCASISIVLFYSVFCWYTQVKRRLIDFGFCVLIVLDGLHFLDFPFMRPVESLSILGFSITLVLFFCTAIYIPVFILKKISDDYALGLTGEVNKRTRQLLEANDLLKNSFATLAEKNIQLEDLSKRNQGLMSILVHDISSPLQILFQNYEVLFFQPEKYISDLENKKTRVNKAIESVNYTLAEAKSFHAAALGKTKSEIQSYSVNEIIIDTIDLFAEKIKAKKIVINLDIEQTKNLKIKINDQWLKSHVLSNLISNAIKFSQISGVVNVYTQVQSDQKLSIYIQDSGVGIPENKKNQLFDYNSVTTSQGTLGELGTGLGLPIVKQYVDLMGGSIQLDKMDQKGTCFRVDLIIS
jgi:signal transduction histidine kinase